MLARRPVRARLQQLRQPGRRRHGLAGAVVGAVQLAQPVLGARSPSASRPTPATSWTRGPRPASTAPSCWRRRRCSGRRPTAWTRSASSSSTTRCPTRPAFSLMEGGGGAAAFVSSKHEARGTDPVVYAPTAVTGFSIGYVIDRPGNAGEFTDLRLTPRLLAKLLTQSYVGSERGRGHPGMSANPVSLNLDPEFQALNPGLDTIAREAAATLLSLSESSDVDADPDVLHRQRRGRDGVHRRQGRPVGHARSTRRTRRSSCRLPSGRCSTTTCRRRTTSATQQNPSPYFTQLAAPVTSLRKIAEADPRRLAQRADQVRALDRHRPVEDRSRRPPGRRHPLHARPRQHRRRPPARPRVRPPC